MHPTLAEPRVASQTDRTDSGLPRPARYVIASPPNPRPLPRSEQARLAYPARLPERLRPAADGTPSRPRPLPHPMTILAALVLIDMGSGACGRTLPRRPTWPATPPRANAVLLRNAFLGLRIAGDMI